MAKYYYTTSKEPRSIYHVSQSCEEGKKIETEKRVETDLFPTGRTLCDVC